MPKLPQPPSFFTGPAFQYLSQVAQAINGLPTVSYFTQQDPNGILQGFDGDVAIYNGSVSTLPRIWVNMSDLTTRPSFFSWMLLGTHSKYTGTLSVSTDSSGVVTVTGSGGTGGGSTGTAAVPFHFALSPDTTGKCYWAPQISFFPSAIAPLAQVLSYGTGSISSAQAIGILSPSVDPVFVLRTSNSSGSQTAWTLQYYVGSNGSLASPAAYTESLGPTNGSNGINYSVVTFTPTAGNISSGDVLQIELARTDASNAGIGFVHTAHVVP